MPLRILPLRILALSLCIGLARCGRVRTAATRTFDFDFSQNAQGWVAGFADYPAGAEADYELASGHRQLPAPLNRRSGFFISGNNHSDDLFMFLKRRVTGLEPG